MKAEQRQDLQELARTLVTPDRFGDLALQDTIEFAPLRLVEFPHRVDDPAGEVPEDFTAPPESA